MFNKVTTNAMSAIASTKARVDMLAKNAKTHVAGDKKAQGILEYGLLFVIVGLGLIAALGTLKETISNKLNEAGQKISSQKV